MLSFSTRTTAHLQELVAGFSVSGDMATGVSGLSLVLVNVHLHPIRSPLWRRFAASSCHFLLDAYLWLDFLSLDALDNRSGQECASQCSVDEPMRFLDHCLHLIQPSVCYVSLLEDLLVFTS